MATPEALPVSELRKVCDPESLDFDRSSELAELVGGLGQERAEEALRFALSMRQPGYHVFVLGEAGTGRHATVARMLSEFAAAEAVPSDLCYVHNFGEPLNPRLLSLPAGMGARLRTRMQQLLREVGPAVDAALKRTPIRGGWKPCRRRTRRARKTPCSSSVEVAKRTGCACCARPRVTFLRRPRRASR